MTRTWVDSRTNTVWSIEAGYGEPLREHRDRVPQMADIPCRIVFRSADVQHEIELPDFSPNDLADMTDAELEALLDRGRG